MNPCDKISSLIWLAASIVIILGSLAYSVGTWSQPGPAFLPLLCGLAIAFFSVIIFVQALWGGRGEAKMKPELAFFTPLWPNLAIVLITLLAYTFLLETLGFIMMTFLFMFIVLKWVGRIRWGTALLEAFITTAASYGLFDKLLKVQMPRGIWGMFF